MSDGTPGLFRHRPLLRFARTAYVGRVALSVRLDRLFIGPAIMTPAYRVAQPALVAEPTAVECYCVLITSLWHYPRMTCRVPAGGPRWGPRVHSSSRVIALSCRERSDR